MVNKGCKKKSWCEITTYIFMSLSYQKHRVARGSGDAQKTLCAWSILSFLIENVAIVFQACRRETRLEGV